MRRILAGLWLATCLAFPAYAQEHPSQPPPAPSPARTTPVAVLSGPATAVVGDKIWLDFVGTVGVSVDLELAKGPAPVNIAKLMDDSGTPIYAVTTVTKPGTYIFSVVAHGVDAEGKPTRVYAFATTVVGGTPGPTPPPGPLPPGPSPEPPPAPEPADPSDPLAVARQWPAALAGTFADSFATAAEDVRMGTKTMDAIKAEHVARWKVSRDSAFNSRFVPMMDSLIPPGTAVPTIEQRRRYADLMDKIVQGTREGSR